MRLSNGFVIDREKTFGELKFTAVRDVFLQNEDGTPSTQLKKRIYDLKCSLHGGIIPVSVPARSTVKGISVQCSCGACQSSSRYGITKDLYGCRCGLVCKGREYCVEK